ncbi:MAG: putative toxin-antitoxin system toxin component, PIN family [Gammaproteobacteria bacterium]|nr:putative toxin-antitoxin system toxin component, PIN family [Gammaproteobacteria bacterium]
MRVVLDTNVLVSALISSSGPPGQLLSAVKRGDMTLVTSEYQLEELRKVLARERLRPYIKPEEAQDLIGNLETVGTLIFELPECRLSPDPADNPILATAIAGNANLIVSGDKTDMLALGHVDDIRIVSPATALAELGRVSG